MGPGANLGDPSEIMENPTTKMSHQPESAATNVAAVTDEMELLRSAALSLLSEARTASTLADGASAVEKAAGALKLVVEIGKTRTELAKADEELAKLKYENKTASKRERSDRIRDYITFFTPLITIVTLAATLGFQGWQFRKSESDRRAEALDAQWREAEKAISTSGELSPGVIALQPFLHDRTYQERAKDLAVELLSNTSDQAFFTSLFGPALTPITCGNLDKLLRLDRRLFARSRPLDDKTWDEAKGINDRNRLSNEERVAYKYVIDAALPQITTQMGIFFKTRASFGLCGSELDLSNTEFTNGDWEGVNLTGANLTNAEIAWTNLHAAQLDVSKYGGFYPYGTAWWEAKSINKDFLKYLIDSYPLQLGRAYGPRSELKDQASYDAALLRLKSDSK
jgi:Pentapeptide repeats (8 copies)